jgi:uncharacterized membrane-anchored protein
MSTKLNESGTVIIYRMGSLHDNTHKFVHKHANIHTEPINIPDEGERCRKKLPEKLLSREDKLLSEASSQV